MGMRDQYECSLFLNEFQLDFGGKGYTNVWMSLKKSLPGINPDHPCVFHCMTRVVGGRRLLKAPDKDLFVHIMHKVAAFHGIEVLTYCFMSNHYHLLAKVPAVNEVKKLSVEDLLKAYRALYEQSNSPGYPNADKMETILRGEDQELAKSWEARLRKRMGNLPEFMKTLNQRLSKCYNKRHGCFGALWAERYKGVLVENDVHVMAGVGAYVDLNPVRAGLTKDPSAYRWNGFGRAMSGHKREQNGFSLMLERADWLDAIKDYRRVLYGKGGNGRINEEGMIDPAKVLKVLKSGGEVSMAEFLHCRIRYLSAGAIIGSRDFVQRMGSTFRSLYHLPPRRKPPVRVARIAGESFPGLYSYRTLVKDPIG